MKKGFTFVEVLVVIVVSVIVLSAVVAVFTASNKAFKKGEEVSELTEDMRSAIANLEFVFSRWGIGVPCWDHQQDKLKTCQLASYIPNCESDYPPSNPMCMTIIGSNPSDVTFYANLYGMGFVTDVTGNNASLISCRLSSETTQNCYYVWLGEKLRLPGSTLVYFQFSQTINNVDCLSLENLENPLTVNKKMTSPAGSIDLNPGDVVMRVPHKIRLYVSDGWLMMDRTDMASGCNLNENNENNENKKIALVEKFSVEKATYGVKVDMILKSQSDPNKKFRVVRYFGR